VIDTASTTRVEVSLGARAYDVLIGPGLLEEAGSLIKSLGGSGRCFIVTDENIARLHLPRLLSSLDDASFSHSLLVLPPGEGQKSWAGLERVSEAILNAGLDRRDLVVALGGGVIGDLAGFAAAIAKRGLDFVQIPTTLLAQVDSSVGGKTAIDTQQGKNLIGAFHQPRLVLADLDVLTTLPPRELRCGLAEVIKYGLIDDPDFVRWCEASANALQSGDPDAIGEAVAVSVRAKTRTVIADERENGARALLNLGHTFGHGLEAIAGMDGVLLHGEAVGCGMAMAYRYSARLGLCPPEDANAATAAIASLGLETDPRRLPGGPYTADAVLAAMAHDKKNESGKITLILARGLGRAFIQKGCDANDLLSFLSSEFT
jgi:3-dehydroquinate synthase